MGAGGTGMSPGAGTAAPGSTTTGTGLNNNSTLGQSQHPCGTGSTASTSPNGIGTTANKNNPSV